MGGASPSASQPDYFGEAGKYLAKQGLNQGLKQGWNYLNNTYDLTGYLSDLFGIGGGLGGGGGAAAGTLGGVVPEMAGAAGADIGMGLGGGGGGAAAGGGIGASAATLGAGAPIAAGTAILTNILMDEINDPKGKVSAAQDYNYLNSQEMPKWAGSLVGASKALPMITDDLNDQQAQNLWKLSRFAAKNSTLMADPLANQGQDEYGVHLLGYPGAAAGVNDTAPKALLGTMRSQDLLADRGITPEEFETATQTQREIQRAREIAAANRDSNGEYFSTWDGMPSAFDEKGNLGGLKAMTPNEMLASIGHYGGFNQDRMSELDMLKQYGISNENAVEGIRGLYDKYGTSNIYTPDVMDKLQAIQPGHYEQGIHDILADQPGYQGSDFDKLWASSPTPTFAVTAPPSGPALPPSLPRQPAPDTSNQDLLEQLRNSVGGG